jgi:hypothetical protein
MPKCVHCGAETVLYVNNVTVCVDCDGKTTVPALSTGHDQPNRQRTSLKSAVAVEPLRSLRTRMRGLSEIRAYKKS